MAGTYAVLNLESRTVVATGLDPQQAHQYAIELPPALVTADEPAAQRIQAAWSAVFVPA
jgi:hypothetical protein